MSATPSRRWYQFSLKAMLAMMTLVCIGPGGFVAYEQRKARGQKVAVEAIENLGGRVEYVQRVPRRSSTMRRILGDESFGNVEMVLLGGTQMTDAGLVHIAELKSLARLDLDDTQVTDAGLVHLAGLTRLEVLFLANTQVADAGLVHLSSLKQLGHLSLIGTPVTDAGLPHLAELTNLETLMLNNTQVTDAGLVHLARFKGLKFLKLVNTQVTDDGVAEIQKALPNCRIVRAAP